MNVLYEKQEHFWYKRKVLRKKGKFIVDNGKKGTFFGIWKKKKCSKAFVEFGKNEKKSKKKEREKKQKKGIAANFS